MVASKGRLTHGGTETTVDLEHGELVEVAGLAVGKVGVRDNLVFAWGPDAVPFAIDASVICREGENDDAYISCALARFAS